MKIQLLSIYLQKECSHHIKKPKIQKNMYLSVDKLCSSAGKGLSIKDFYKKIHYLRGKCESLYNSLIGYLWICKTGTRMTMQ